MNAQIQAFEVRAIPLIVLLVSALLLLWASAGASILLNPNTVEPAERWVGLLMLVIFGGMFLQSLVGLFNYRIRVDYGGITILLPFGGSVTYARDELDFSIKGRIIRLRPVSGAKLGCRRLFIPQRWIGTYLIVKRKEGLATTS